MRRNGEAENARGRKVDREDVEKQQQQKAKVGGGERAKLQDTPSYE